MYVCIHNDNTLKIRTIILQIITITVMMMIFTIMIKINIVTLICNDIILGQTHIHE